MNDARGLAARRHVRTQCLSCTIARLEPRHRAPYTPPQTERRLLLEPRLRTIFRINIEAIRPLCWFADARVLREQQSRRSAGTLGWIASLRASSTTCHRSTSQYTARMPSSRALDTVPQPRLTAFDQRSIPVIHLSRAQTQWNNLRSGTAICDCGGPGAAPADVVHEPHHRLVRAGGRRRAGTTLQAPPPSPPVQSEHESDWMICI